MEAKILDGAHPRQIEIDEALFETQRLAGIGTLAASVAHELTNPISVITATCHNLQVLASENELKPQDLDRYLDMINSSAWRCVRVIQMLRHYSHIDGSKINKCDLNEIVGDSLTLVSYQFERQYNIEIHTDLSPHLPLLNCDRNQITQVLINLLTNARDALPEKGGKIWIHSWYDPDKRSSVLAVRDNGTGIDPEIVERIFEPFFTTKAPGKGTGLGLAIAAQIIEKHDGRIRVKPDPEAGTTFLVELPDKVPDLTQSPSSEPF